MARVNWKHAVVVGAVGLLALVGCSKGNEATVSDATSSPATTTTAPEASPSSADMNQTANDSAMNQTANEGFDGLLAVVANTKASVEAGDFTKAQADFNNFETFWSQVEDDIKTKSSESYDAIESSMDKIAGELSAGQPNKDTTLTELQNLETTLNSVKP